MAVNIIIVMGMMCCTFLCDAQKIRKLGEIEVIQPGFTNLFVHEENTDPKEKYSLLLSTFNVVPFTRDPSYMFRYPGLYLDDVSQSERLTLGERFVWPREPSQTPNDVFGYESITQPSGFLLIGKNTGTIDVIDMRDPENPVIHDIVSDPEGDDGNFYYHRVLWKDMNGDGRKDAVTLRARTNIITGNTNTEMVWFEHPETNIFDAPWKKHPINENIGGTFMIEAELTADGQTFDVILTVGYFTHKLAVLWTTHPEGLWTDLNYVETHIIDEAHNGEEKQFFDIYVNDLNQDGRLDLLVSINSATNGTIWAYEIPDDFRVGEYKKHLIADGFYSQSGLQGGGAPGSPGIFYPDLSDTSGRPWLFTSADDQGVAFYFVPPDDDGWKYEMVEIVDEGPGNIVGKLTAADMDGDGFSELFIPAYTKDKIHVYTFAP